jgi:hypothetical protein
MTTKEKILTRLINEGAITIAEATILNDYKAINKVEQPLTVHHIDRGFEKSFYDIIGKKS